MKHLTTKLVIALLIAALLLMPVGAIAEDPTGGPTIPDGFTDIGADAKPMFRSWFDNAGYAYEDLKAEMTDLYEKGFGGIEVATIPNAVYEDTSLYWAQPGWIDMIKNILKIAAELPGEFKVDITISPYWPVAVDDITPNDESASTELVYAWTKLGGADGVIDLPMPEIDLLADGVNAQIPFIHTNRFEAATLAQVRSVVEDGTIVLDDASMRDISTLVTQKTETTPAGIPDFDNADVQAMYNGMDNLFMGFFGDRAVMQDTQYYYALDTAALELGEYTASEGETLAEGDWVVFGFYRKGTGETHNKSYDEMSPFGIHVYTSTPNGCVCINEFNAAGADAITGYWDRNILKDEELVALLKANACDLFEDSLEVVSATPFWTEEILKQFSDEAGYDLTPYLPIIADEKGPEDRVRFASSGDLDQAVWNDYQTVLGSAYSVNHLKRISDWSNETINTGFRVQAYGNACIDSGLAAYNLDTAEGETLAFNHPDTLNRFRAVAAGVHMAGKPYVSDECMAVQLRPYQLTWKDYFTRINQDYVSGANRIILHGYNFYKPDPSGAGVQWPGFSTMGTFFSEPFGPRQAYWEDVKTFTGYTGRMQTVLQGGKPAADLAVYETDTFTGETPDVAAALNAGYSYDVLSTGLLVKDEVVADEGKISAGAVTYKALIVYDMPTLTLSAAQKLLALARGGASVIFYPQTPASLTPSCIPENGTDDDLTAVMGELLVLENAVEAADDAALLAALDAAGVEPDAKAEGLKTLHRVDVDGTDYYYLLNDTEEAAETTVALKGEGEAYLLDAWTGMITKAEDEPVDGRFTMTLKLAPHEAVLTAVGNDLQVNEDPTATPEGGDTLALTGWDIALESWGPFPVEDTVNTHIAKKTVLTYEDQALVSWNELPADESRLAELGVDSMDYVSGIATYTTTFDLPESWNSGDSIDLAFAHGSDEVTVITVNGTVLDNINAMSDRVSIGQYLVEGENTITIRVASTIGNRFIYENFHNGNNWAMTFAGFAHINEPAETVSYGLTDVQLIR